jgi:hypothetical protein
MEQIVGTKAQLIPDTEPVRMCDTTHSDEVYSPHGVLLACLMFVLHAFSPLTFNIISCNMYLFLRIADVRGDPGVHALYARSPRV